LGVKIRPSLPLFSPNFYPRNALSIASCEHHSFEPSGQNVAFVTLIAQRTLLGGRYAGDTLAGAWRKQVMWGHQLPLPFPFPLALPFLPPLPSPAPSFQPSSRLFLPFSSLPVPSRPLHSLPLPLYAVSRPLTAAKGSGSALAPPAGPGGARWPNDI